MMAPFDKLQRSLQNIQRWRHDFRYGRTIQQKGEGGEMRRDGNRNRGRNGNGNKDGDGNEDGDGGGDGNGNGNWDKNGNGNGNKNGKGDGLHDSDRNFNNPKDSFGLSDSTQKGPPPGIPSASPTPIPPPSSPSIALTSTQSNSPSVPPIPSSAPISASPTEPLPVSAGQTSYLSAWSTESTTDQGRKGLYSNTPVTVLQTMVPSSSSYIASTSSSSVVASATASSATSSAAIASNSGTKDHRGLSSTAAHLLIAAGSIGAFILIIFLTYAALRLMKIDVLGGLRRFTRRLHRTFPQKHGGMGDPYYSLSDEKSTPHRLKYTPINFPSQETSRLTPGFPPEHKERQTSVQELPPNQVLFVVNPDKPQPILQPPAVYSLNKRVSNLSTLSSLSSGFGDAKIEVPELAINVQPRLIDNPASRSPFIDRFSWEVSRQSQPPSYQPRSQDIRYTVNTAMSEESTPRFRSVNSWVNQQMSRIERQRMTDKEADTVPDISVPKAAMKS